MGPGISERLRTLSEDIRQEARAAGPSPFGHALNALATTVGQAAFTAYGIEASGTTGSPGVGAEPTDGSRG